MEKFEDRGGGVSSIKKSRWGIRGEVRWGIRVGGDRDYIWVVEICF